MIQMKLMILMILMLLMIMIMMTHVFDHIYDIDHNPERDNDNHLRPLLVESIEVDVPKVED